MSGLQNLSLEQAAVLIASRVRVKQADIEKQAVPAWGGQHISFAPKNKGIGLTAGYDYLAGTIPIPYLGLDIGGQDHGVSLSGPVPGIGARAGFMSRPPGVTRHIANHRSLWKTIGDSLAGRDREDFLQQEYGPHRAAVFQNMKDKDLLRAMPRITGDDADYAKLPADRQQFLKELAKAIRDPKTYAADDDEILVDDPALLESKTASGRVKQAVESTTKPEYSQTLQQPVTQPDPSRNATSPAGGAPGIMDRIRAALSNIDFGSLANKGMDAAKGFSPSSNPLHAALLGGGLGMGVGALGSLTSSDKEKRKRWLRNALFGGAMGGIGGYGAHAAFNYGNDLTNDLKEQQKAEMEKPQVPTMVERASHTVANPTSTVVGGLTGGAAGHVAGKMYDRYKDNKAVAGIIGSKDFKPHLDAANEKMRRAGTPEITQAQVDQFGRASTAMPWQTLFGGKGAPHLVATPEAAPPTPQASASRAVIPYNAAQAAKAQATQPVPPVASFTAKPVREHVSYRKPKLTAEQLGPLMEGYGHYTAKNPVVRKRPFGLGGVGGTMLGAGLGAALTAAGTPHLSNAQKQQ